MPREPLRRGWPLMPHKDPAKKAEYDREYHAKHRAARVAYVREWSKRNVDKVRVYRQKQRPRNTELSKKYRDSKLERLAGRACPSQCEVCGLADAAGRRLAFDHDHASGAFRGWLCARCNTALGLVGDDVELLDRLIMYLSRSRRPKLRAV